MATRSQTIKLSKKIPSNNNKSCKCKDHEKLCAGVKPKRTHKTQGKEISRKKVKYLVDNNLLGPDATYVCSTCIEHAQKMMNDSECNDEMLATDDIEMGNANEISLLETSIMLESDMSIVESEGDKNEIIQFWNESNTEERDLEENARTDNMNESKTLLAVIDGLIGALKSLDDFDDALNGKLSELMFHVAKKCIREKIKDHCRELKELYNDIEHLQTLDSKSFLRDCNELLVQFLCGATGVNLKLENDTKVLYRFAMAVESIYHLKNCNMILPHCFQMNLIQKQVSGSKTVAAVNGKVLPGGSDTTLRDWWNFQGSAVLSMPSSGDIVVYFDNVGKYIVKTYRVKGERNEAPTVVSAVQVIHLTPSLSNTANIFLQQSVNPYIHDIHNLTESDIQKRMIRLRDASLESYRVYRFKFIAAIFEYMLRSLEMETCISNELKKMEAAEFTRECSKCGIQYPPRKQKCDACSGQVVSISNNADVSYDIKNMLPKFLDIGQAANPNPAKIETAESIMLNPNSLENVEAIITEIKKNAKVRDDRGEEKEGRSWLFIGADGQPASYMRRIKQREPEKYKWLLILSGKGHLKMNMVKGLFKFSDQIFLKFLAQDVLKFDTVKSYDYFIKCKDTHKSYQAIEIMLFGTIMELIRTYGASVEKPTPLGFLEWTTATKNPNQKFMSQFLLNYVLAMYIHKVGDRYNDARCSDAGRMKFLDFFFALNHPIYREVEYHDLRERALYSPQIYDIRTHNTAYKNDDESCVFNHQDGDFKLEERVRRMKRMSPKGKMNKEMWQRVARGMDNVDLVVEHGKNLLNLSDDFSSRVTSLENEIIKWRSVLRNSRYLTGSIPDLTSMDGKGLNPALRNLPQAVEKKRELYFQHALKTDLEHIRYEILSPFGYDDDEISPYSSDQDEDDDN